MLLCSIQDVDITVIIQIQQYVLDLYTVALLMTPNILFTVEYALTHWSDAFISTDIITP